MTVLRSYVSGAWTDPADDGRPVLDAVTGEEVARVSSAGIDLGAALGYGRSAGGPALRELTFHQRAALLKSLGRLLREHRQELYALSARTGATLGRLQVRRRRRHRRTAQLRQQGQARAAERHDPRRGGGRAARQGRDLRRPAHPHPAARGRGADQRVQLPGLGAAGEIRPRVHRRRAEPGQAGHPDRVPDGPAGGADGGLRAAARKARSSWSAAASATCSIIWASRTWCRSPGRPPPPGSCAPTRPSSGGRYGSTPRRTR